jgi:hypothetical protein
VQRWTLGTAEKEHESGAIKEDNSGLNTNDTYYGKKDDSWSKDYIERKDNATSVTDGIGSCTPYY